MEYLKYWFATLAVIAFCGMIAFTKITYNKLNSAKEELATEKAINAGLVSYIAARNVTEAAWTKQLTAIAEQQKQQKDKYREIIHFNPEAKDWSITPVPANITDLLREGAASASSARP